VTDCARSTRTQFVIHRVGNIDVGQEVASGTNLGIRTILEDYDRMTKLVPSDYK
jgi:hypothetical protein